MTLRNSSGSSDDTGPTALTWKDSSSNVLSSIWTYDTGSSGKLALRAQNEVILSLVPSAANVKLDADDNKLKMQEASLQITESGSNASKIVLFDESSSADPSNIPSGYYALYIKNGDLYKMRADGAEAKV